MKRIIPIALLLFASTAWGTTYYMRADGSAANKAAATGPCDNAALAMSVSTHNAETFSAGDTINLCDDGGDYKASIIAPSGGSAGSPITYQNATGSTPDIDLSESVANTGWADNGSGLYSKVSYAGAFWEDGVPLPSATTAACSDGNYYYLGGSGVLYYRPTSGTPADHTLIRLWFDGPHWTPYGIDLRDKSYITVQGITFNRVGGGIGHGQTVDAPVVTEISNITIDNNTFTNNFVGVYSQLDNNAVESDVAITNNTFNYSNQGSNAWSNSDETAGHTQYHTRYTITGNTISNHASIKDGLLWQYAIYDSATGYDHEGISFQNVKDSVISGNTITAAYDASFGAEERNYMRGIFLYFTNGDTPTANNIVRNNYITGHFRPAINISGAYGSGGGFDNNIIAYNVLKYTGSNTDHISFMHYVTADNPDTNMNYLVNNTIYNEAGLGIYFAADYIAGNWSVKNNIVHSPERSYSTNANDNAHVVFSNNIYDNVSNTGGFAINGASKTFVQWQGTYGQDTFGSSIADPVFVSPSTSDFRLQATSPAINAATNVGLTSDILGNPVPTPQ